jgi:hypothetical protein
MAWIGLIPESLTGDITSVVAGAGLTGGGIDGDVTLNVIGGSGITANANDIAITAAQTTITSVLNASLVIGRDADNDIDFTTDNNIRFRVGGEDQLTLIDGALTPTTNAIVDLGTDDLEFKDGYFDGTLEADAITIGGTNIVSGSVITSLGTLSTLSVDNITVNANEISSTNTNGNIDLNPHGSGIVEFQGNATRGAGQFVLNCEVNTHGVTIKGPPHSASADYTLTLPNNDGDADQVLKTDGSGNLAWVAQSGGGGSGDMTQFYLEDDGGTEVTINNNKEVKFIGAGITTSWTDTSTGNDADPYDLTFTVDAAQPNITSLGSAGATTNILAGDLTMYNAVNDGNPTISLGSSATNRFEIKTDYNSGAQTVDQVYFSTYTTSTTSNDGRYIFEVDEVELGRILDDGLSIIGFGLFSDYIQQKNTTASSATEGGKLILMADDGAAMADGHRLGVVEFSGAEDASNNRQTGAKIQAMCDATWSASENGTRLEFYTMDGNAASELSLTLDSDKVATFTGDIVANRKLNVTSATHFEAKGDIVYLGSGSTTQGELCYLKADGAWAATDADAVATSGGVLLALALGTDPDADGMLLRGMFTLDHDPGTIADELYVSTTAGDITGTAPSGSGDIVRVVGYCLDSTNGQIWFNPSNDFIVLA